jgi:hypothetical protein
MCSLRNVTASVAEGKERSGDSWFAPGHRNGVAPDDCAGRDGVEVCIGARVGAVVGSHAARTTRTGSQTQSLRRTHDALLLDSES